ncbi:MAG: FAD-dependent oxidoreductase, partial [Nannocystaceae bacterium]
SPFPGRPFVGLVHSPLHWLFDRSHIEGQQGGDILLNATISGARAFMEDAATSLEQLLIDELARFFPQRPIELKQMRVIKEKRATISHAAGTYHWRPEARSPVSGLLLAGDWVRTGLPATIESAVQSGHEAAALALKTAS